MSEHRTIGTVLCATDFSEHSRVAVAQAAATCRAEKARLILLHVDTGHDETPADTLHAVAQGIRDVAVETHVVQGHADEVIVEVARQHDVDLVVTGTRGRTGLKRFFLGSVAEKVVRLCETNVLVARSHPDGNMESGLFDRILVPTDFSPAAEKALHLAMLLAAPGATIELLHAWQFPPGTPAKGLPSDERSPLAALQREIEHSAEEHGETWVTRHQTGEMTLRFYQRHGPAAAVVQERLEAEPFDLVATGTHGRRGFRRFVLGSVAEATVRHSPCSVLVAHAGDL